MKMNFLKGVFLIAFVTLGVADMSAQSFSEKIEECGRESGICNEYSE